MWPSYYEIIIPAASLPILLLALWRIGIRNLKTYRSPLLGKIEILQKYNGEKVLATNSYPQGISVEQKSIKESYWYAVAKLAADRCQNKTYPKVLMFGLGANTIPQLIAKLNPHIHQTVVEIDPLIIQACKEYFQLDQTSNLNVLQADAYKIVTDKKAFPEKFDAIIVDLFTCQPPYLSHKSNQPPFIQKLLPLLKENGRIIFNRPAHNDAVRKEGEGLQRYLQTVFKTADLSLVKDPRGFKNHVIWAEGKGSR